jgi:hypothetical protein
VPVELLLGDKLLLHQPLDEFVWSQNQQRLHFRI